MWDFILELIAKLLGRRDDNTVPPETTVEGAPDEVDDDRPTTPVDLTAESKKETKPPLLPPPPTILPPGIEVPPPVEEPTVEPAPTGITVVGAWCGGRALSRPDKYVEFARTHGINRLDIVVNDHSKWREPSDFTVRNSDKILRLAQAARRAGIEVHLMSWIMPHRAYISQAAEILIPLAEMAQAASIQWDAEEPWMKARNHMGYEAAAEHLAESFRRSDTPMGVNGIGYASVAKLGPLAEVCDYVVPQIYSTASNGLDPKEAPAKFHRRWSKHFQKPVVVGLAAYRQKGIPGYTEAQAMQAAVDATRAIPDVNTVIYWSLYHITKNKTVAKVVAGIRDQRTDAPVA